MRLTTSTPTKKAMMDKQDSYISKAMTTPLTVNFTLPTKSFTMQIRPMTRKKMMNVLKTQMTQA
jgi:hypothetical protein